MNTDRKNADSKLGDRGGSELKGGLYRAGSIQNNSFNMRLLEKKANRDQINKINQYITELVGYSGIKQEDMSDKFNLLKKVEIKLHSMYEFRKIYEVHSAKEMHDEEKKIANETSKVAKQENRDA